ncbi:MAG: serine hydrolase [Clostridia bacterium]|nr:serine hydrolase [Clostridia bacterium]
MNRIPETCGISSASIELFLRELNAHGFAMHSVLLARRGEIVYEGYWKPFSAEYLHRMNSVTKSFVGIAVGLLIEDGLLSLDDKAVMFFPDDLPEEVREELGEQTVRDMLTMRTCITPGAEHWIRDKVQNRTKDYFLKKPTRPADTLFFYDTTGNFLLTRIVEDLTGKPFLEYLRERILSKIGFSENAVCIKGNDGYSWGDSGLLCTTRDLLLFAEFLRCGGKWKGEQLMDANYIKAATARQTASNVLGWETYGTFGYGYQIWKTWDDGFAFFGMGDQVMICLPAQELIFVCTADNQGCAFSRMMILDAFDRHIRQTVSSVSLPEAPEAFDSLRSYTETLSLVSLCGEKEVPCAAEIDGKTVLLEDNPMGIRWCRFRFADGQGVMEYENATGRKELPFAFEENLFSQFPEEGYPDMEICDFTPGNFYPCATSAAWQDARTLAIKTFMIGKHLGALYITVGFRADGKVGLRMLRNTNCFLHTYNGYATGRILKE